MVKLKWRALMSSKFLLFLVGFPPCSLVIVKELRSIELRHSGCISCNSRNGKHHVDVAHGYSEAAANDGIGAELINLCPNKLKVCQHRLIVKIWDTDQLLEEWREGVIY